MGFAHSRFPRAGEAGDGVTDDQPDDTPVNEPSSLAALVSQASRPEPPAPSPAPAADPAPGVSGGSPVSGNDGRTNDNRPAPDLTKPTVKPPAAPPAPPVEPTELAVVIPERPASPPPRPATPPPPPPAPPAPAPAPAPAETPKTPDLLTRVTALEARLAEVEARLALFEPPAAPLQRAHPPQPPQPPYPVPAVPESDPAFARDRCAGLYQELADQLLPAFAWAACPGVGAPQPVRIEAQARCAVQACDMLLDANGVPPRDALLTLCQVSPSDEATALADRLVNQVSALRDSVRGLVEWEYATKPGRIDTSAQTLWSGCADDLAVRFVVSPGLRYDGELLVFQKVFTAIG